MEDLFIIESGKKRRAEKHICKYCGKEFLRRKNAPKPKQYCTYECSKAGRRKRIKVNCYRCGKELERPPSKINNSRHGYSFCSRKCKEYSQSLKGDCPDIRPDHYGTSEGRNIYRNLIKNHKNSRCVSCGENTQYLLLVHHIDKDRTNNKESNLEVVCANCHIKRHLRKENNKWVFSYRSLTPRDKLLEV